MCEMLTKSLFLKLMFQKYYANGNAMNKHCNRDTAFNAKSLSHSISLNLIVNLLVITTTYATTTLPAITLLLLDDELEQTTISADLRSLTRVDGVSPETIYFSADQSFDNNDHSLQHRYGRLAYHFNFDDPDSGNFSTTGNSKNSQVGGSPRR